MNVFLVFNTLVSDQRSQQFAGQPVLPFLKPAGLCSGWQKGMPRVERENSMEFKG